MKREHRSFASLQRAAREIRSRYAEQARQQGTREWGTAEFLQGFVGDVGALAKLIMQRTGARTGVISPTKLEAKLAHELADCLWSVLILADDVGVDLEKAFASTMDELRGRLSATRGKNTRSRRRRTSGPRRSRKT